MKRLRPIIYLLILCTIGLTITQPTTVEAHTSLTEASPAADSHLEKTPESIKLTFSSKIAPDLSSVSIYNEKNELIKDTSKDIGEDQKSVLLHLPELASGVYKVDYKVVSIDGHPVEGTYSFTLELPEPVTKETEEKEVTAQEEKEEAAAEDGSVGVEKDNQKLNSNTQTSVNKVQEVQHSHETSTYLIRLLYFFSILALAGWVLWGVISSILNSSAKPSYLKGSMLLRLFLLIMLAVYGYLQFSTVVSGINELQTLLLQTPFGIGWLIMFVLSLLGFLILHRSRIIDVIWVIILLFGEVLIGHAIANDPLLLTTFLDMVHLVAAAVWVGGLMILMSFWKNHRPFIKEFLPAFSRYALLSVLLLTITGSLMTILFLPDLSLLVETLWGKVLLFKTGMVVILITLAFFIRKAMKNKQDSKLKKLVEWDFGIMIGIVLLVSILTVVSPTQEKLPEGSEADVTTSEIN